MGQKTALIFGITGQDGAYLAHELIKHGYSVIGSSRDAQMADTRRLKRLNIHGSVDIISVAPNDFRSVLKAVSTIQPDEIYNLAGQTSVSLSFEQPVECMESIAGGTLNLLEVLRYLGKPIRLFNAGSSECFGDTGRSPANERTAFQPVSPYAVAKSTAYWQIANYRKAYGLYACTGILANHESPLRPKRFVTQKIIQAIKGIKAGTSKRLQLGNLNIWRDWGWSPDYVQAMHAMLQVPTPEDYVIATGTSHSLREFVDLAFQEAGLIADEHLESSEALQRPSEIHYSAANPEKIRKDLGWTCKRSLAEIVHKMSIGELF